MTCCICRPALGCCSLYTLYIIMIVLLLARYIAYAKYQPNSVKLVFATSNVDVAWCRGWHSGIPLWQTQVQFPAQTWVHNMHVYTHQISGSDSRFVVEANSKSWWPKSSRSRIVKLMDRGRVTRPRVEYRVKYRVKYWFEYRMLGEFLSIKVEFLLDSGNKSYINGS